MFCLLARHLTQSLAVFLRNSHFHLREVALFLNRTTEHLFFRVHIVVVVEVDGLGAGGCRL